MPFARNNLASASSVSLLPRPRMRDITSDRFRLEKTSAMDTNYADGREFIFASRLKGIRPGKNDVHFFTGLPYKFHTAGVIKVNETDAPSQMKPDSPKPSDPTR